MHYALLYQDKGLLSAALLHSGRINHSALLHLIGKNHGGIEQAAVLGWDIDHRPISRNSRP